jgi:hypothetical protein
MIRLEGGYTFEVKRDELTVADWTRELQRCFYLRRLILEEAFGRA